VVPINEDLRDAEVWNENAIAARIEMTFERAPKLWPKRIAGGITASNGAGAP
jgi:hypothetical protein